MRWRWWSVAARVLPEDDSNLVLALWYAVQSVLARDSSLKCDPILSVCRHPLIARNAARYLIARGTPAQRARPSPPSSTT